MITMRIIYFILLAQFQDVYLVSRALNKLARNSSCEENNVKLHVCLYPCQTNETKSFKPFTEHFTKFMKIKAEIYPVGINKAVIFFYILEMRVF